MELLVRLTAEIILFSILSLMVASATKTQCGTMSCAGHEECYLFYSYKGYWYYESKFSIQRGFRLANVASSTSCYKYVVKRNTLTSSCLEMEKYCIESGGSIAVIDSNQEYVAFNEFILDVTRVEGFVPVYRKLLAHVDALPMARMNKTCSHMLVKDGLLDDNGGYILPQPCAEETLLNSVLCEYSNIIETNKEPICETSPTVRPTPRGRKHTTTVAMRTLTRNASITDIISLTDNTIQPTNATYRKTIGLASTTLVIIGLLFTLIVLLTCMLLYIGKIKHNRRQERYVVRARHHAIRSVHLYDSPLDEWMDKPYFFESQQERLCSSADSTSFSSSSDVPSVDSDKLQHISCDPSTGSYENHCIYASICREFPQNNYKFPYENQDAFKDYYNFGTTNLETRDSNIVMKSMYNSLQVRPDLEIEPRVNGNNRQSIRAIFYDKLSRSSTRSLLSMPNRYNSRTSDDHEGFELSYTSSEGKTGYHHLDRRCTTIAIGNRSRGEHDYSKLMNVTAT